MNQADLSLLDSAIHQQLLLSRFVAGEQGKVYAVILQMQKELRLKLLGDLTDFGKARVKALLKQCDEIIVQGYNSIQGQLDLQDIGQYAAETTVQSFTAIGLEASLPTVAVMKALVNGSVIEGAPSAAYWARQSADLQFKFASQVRQGIAQGETIMDIVRRVAGSPKLGIPGIMDVSRRNAFALVHTSVMQVANDARLATFRANDDIVKGVRQLSTLDGHTSKVCIAYSGGCWDLDGNPIMGTTLPFNGGTPRHFSCRSVLVPITKSYRELGISMDELPPGTRASDLGQIPSDISFSDFLKMHDKNYADDLLGKGRAELWRKGTITLSDLLNFKGNPLTLKQLNAKYKP